jgi:hypothetical protein
MPVATVRTSIAPVKPLSPVGAGGQVRQDAVIRDGWTSNEADHEALAMRLPRVTTRQWMVAVALVALTIGIALGGIRLKRQRDRHLLHAALHQSHVDLARKIKKGSPGPLASRLIEYHASMARRYRHAARYPWLPVEPEPPAPEP